jgi:hypothetical protein
VIRKIVRGLFYKATTRRLPPEYDVIAYAIGVAEQEEPYRTTERRMLDYPPTTVGHNGFVWRSLFSTEDPNLATWHLTFYGTVSYLGFTRRIADRATLMLLERPGAEADGE